MRLAEYARDFRTCSDSQQNMSDIKTEDRLGFRMVCLLSSDSYGARIYEREPHL